MNDEKTNWGSMERVEIEIPNGAVIPCLKCGGIMKQEFDELGMVMTCNPPISGWNWVCSECGHTISHVGHEQDGKYFISVYVEE